jgi:hypothetical protein
MGAVSVAGPGPARYLLGVACLLAIGGGLGAAAIGLRRRLAPELSGAPARLAEAVLALGVLVAGLELLGAVGLFRLVPIVLVVVAVGVAAWRLRPPATSPPGEVVRAAPRAAVALAAAAGGAVLAAWSVPALHAYGAGIRSFDSLWYHLPWAAGFAQTGWTTPLHFTDVEYLTAFYPACAELLHGLGIVLLGRDTLSPALNLGWLALLLLGGWCLGRPHGVAPASLMGAALACATPMMIGSQAGTAANDAAAVALLVAACALLPRAGLGGLAAGLAAGVKLTVLPAVAALTLGALWLAPGGRRAAWTRRWFGGLAVGGAYWYVRNLIAVGNPLPWVHVPGLPVPAPPLQAHTAFSLAHYIGALGRGVFADGFAAGLGRWWAPLLVACLAGPVLCLLQRGEPRTRVLGLVALVADLAYAFTPESAAGPAGHPLGFAFNVRYLAPGLVLSLATLPLAPALRGRRAQAVVLAGGVAALGATLDRPGRWPAAYVPGAIVMALAALAVVGGRGRRPAIAAVLATALVVGGWFGQRHYLRGRYAYAPHVSSLARVWAFFRGVHGARVGVVGTFGGFFDYPLFGLDDSNRVQYIAHAGPHGSFTPIHSCRAWRAAVNAARVSYLVTTPARDPWRPQRLERSPEAGWTAGDAAVHPVLRYTARRQPIVVFAVRGRLDPSGCPAG